MINVTDKLKVREIFYSIQGEGSRQGIANIFIRLALCNKNCWFCDTNWSYGDKMTIGEIINEISKYNCKNIIWTGGEPTLQLTDDIVDYFKSLGYYQAIETNGTNSVPEGIDYITCSPKVTPDVLHKSFPNGGVGEYRYPVGKDFDLPPNIEELPVASHYFVSPIFLGEEKKRFDISDENVTMVIDWVLNDPRWKLSLQIHKLLNIR